MFKYIINYSKPKTISYTPEASIDYEYLWICPHCGREYTGFYGIPIKCITGCQKRFPDFYNIRRRRWSRVLWHFSDDPFKSDFYSTESKKFEESFNDKTNTGTK